MIQNWQPQNLVAVNELLARYETFEPSRQVIAKYLDESRQALAKLPEPLLAIDEISDRLGVLLRKLQAKRQFAPGCLQHDAVSAHFHIVIHARRCRRRRLAALAGAESKPG